MLSVFVIVDFGPKSLLNTVSASLKLWLSIAKSEPTGYVRERGSEDRHLICLIGLCILVPPSVSA